MSKAIGLIERKKLGMYGVFKTSGRAFNRYYDAGYLSLATRAEYKKMAEFQKKHIGEVHDSALAFAYKGVVGEFDERVLPGSVYWKKLLPYFNDLSFRKAYSDKNIYSLLAPGCLQPETYLKVVRGRVFDASNKSINIDDAQSYLCCNSRRFIAKPSRGDNGKLIKLFSTSDNSIYTSNGEELDFMDMMKMFGDNFICQEVIEQHPVLAEPHPSSVNTLRVLTLRWGNKIHHLLTFARFGCDGKVNDNAGTGGVCAGVKDDGSFNSYFVNEKAIRINEHPSTGHALTLETRIPNYSDVIETAKKLHENIYHFDMVSWDFAINKYGDPVFIEFNFRGAMWLYQLASGKPLLGGLTEEILSSLKKNNVF